MPHLDRDQLLRVVQTYGCAHVAWTGAGCEASASGPGGGLVQAVEHHGLLALAAALADGHGVVLQDGEVRVELHREGAMAIQRVAWTDGPSYEERIRLGGTDPRGWTRLVPLPATAPAPSAAIPAAPAAPLPAPAPRPALAGGELLATLHDPRCALTQVPGGLAHTLPGELPAVPAVDPNHLGAASFRQAHGVRAAYVAGAMAGGIASPALVIAMSKAGLLGFFGAGGLPMRQVEQSVTEIQAAVGDGPAGFNLLHNPVEPGVEEATVDLYIRHGCTRVSASAYMRLTRAVVRYRLHGIHAGPDGQAITPNKVFAKVSRPEVAVQFMRPAPADILGELVEDGTLTSAQAALAATVPVAEDITAEADSGGHTDRRPLVVLLPLLLRTRDQIAAEQGYGQRGISLRVGAAGGLGDPTSLHAALSMGADYLLTGSINQSSVEAGTSRAAKELIAAASFTDVATGPAPDMFELGAHVQVLSRGSMYAQRATRLYQLYKAHNSLGEIPSKERRRLEKNIFKRPLEEVWADTKAYWIQRDPREATKAESDPHHQMALTFRWYLGMTSRWARTGEADRKRDYQIWCGPSMGLFNTWVHGSDLAPLEARTVTRMADRLLHGAAVLRRVDMAAALGIALPPGSRSPAP